MSTVHPRRKLRCLMSDNLQPRPVLAQNELHVWYAYTERCLTPERRATYLDLLADDERQSLDRFATPALQDEYLLTRSICRTTLSLYSDIMPQHWKFERNAYGRPFVVSPSCATNITFNLTNSRSLVAMVVGVAGREIGIDVENISRANDIMGIARSYFSPREKAELEALPEARRHRRFFELWTLKESYIKARGKGLSLPLDSFSMRFTEDGIGIAFAATGDLIDHAWQFMLTSIESQHVLAVCAARHRQVDVVVRMYEAP